ncbi:unnamed protein product [Timema podura]|uniref:Uncharacterized protein n=1 Tax=Timema podura TaxID=61482 RepID=A0ABN7NCS1_TIMPD|nr:unnamed protein product [Timema podura]
MFQNTLLVVTVCLITSLAWAYVQKRSLTQVTWMQEERWHAFPTLKLQPNSTTIIKARRYTSLSKSIGNFARKYLLEMRHIYHAYRSELNLLQCMAQYFDIRLQSLSHRHYSTIDLTGFAAELSTISQTIDSLQHTVANMTTKLINTIMAEDKSPRETLSLIDSVRAAMTALIMSVFGDSRMRILTTLLDNMIQVFINNQLFRCASQYVQKRVWDWVETEQSQ